MRVQDLQFHYRSGENYTAGRNKEGKMRINKIGDKLFKVLIEPWADPGPDSIFINNPFIRPREGSLVAHITEVMYGGDEFQVTQGEGAAVGAGLSLAFFIAAGLFICLVS